MSRFIGSRKCVLKCRFSDDSGIVRPGDEETASIGKTVYYSPQEEGVCHSHGGEGHDRDCQAAQEAEEKGEIRKNLGSCFQDEER